MDNDLAFEESFNLLCGDLLGDGMSRKVFACTLLPDCVVKVETDRERFQNIIEWETWRMVEGTAASRWFARCRWISPRGTVLVMERTQPIPLQDLPKKVPAWFTDLKRGNWGWVGTNKPGKRFAVCHDYGTSLALQEGTVTKRMRKAEWYDE